MSELALFGGTKVRTTAFPTYVTIGEEEQAAAARVVSKGVLSDYLGRSGPRFLGGPEVRALEDEWCAHFGAKYAVSVNSATSGLYAAIGAIGLRPGDEVVVSPFTMSASATGPLVYGGKPVFADIDAKTFCLTRETIEKVLTDKTRAVVVVDLFGHPADMDPIMDLARERNLIVVEDAAQAAGSTYRGKAAGTLAHMGVYSLNVHKIIQCGEGGVVVTDDARLAERLRLVRNHGEVIVRETNAHENADIIGFNYRMTEIEAAISREQLKKLERFAKGFIENTEYLHGKLRKVPGFTPLGVLPECRSVYYQCAFHYDAEAIGVPRARWLEALRAEGVPFGGGYVEPLYFQPLYSERWPGDAGYARGACPTAEAMWTERLVTSSLNHPQMTQRDLDDVVRAVEKVYARRHELAKRPS